MLILFAGIAGEAMADAQLKRFRTIPPTRAGSAISGCGAGRVIPIISSNGSVGWPIPSSRSDGLSWGWATLLAPLFMYWLLVHVSGIPPLEAQMLRSRGERYRDYQTRTSVFFPLPPHRGRST